MFFTRKLDWYGKDRAPVFFKQKESKVETNPENTGGHDSEGTDTGRI
jgi:hypothetical protein